MYEFKVEARSAYGYSVHSEPLELLCAFIPEPPQTVTISNVDDTIVIEWD